MVWCLQSWINIFFTNDNKIYTGNVIGVQYHGSLSDNIINGLTAIPFEGNINIFLAWHKW